MGNSNNSGRSMLRKLLPALFFVSGSAFSATVTYNGYVFPLLPQVPPAYSNPNGVANSAEIQARKNTTAPGCNFIQGDFGSYGQYFGEWRCYTLGDAFRLSAKFDPSFNSFGLLPPQFSLCGEGNYDWKQCIKSIRYSQGSPSGSFAQFNIGFESPIMKLTSGFMFDFGFGSLACINDCKAQLTAVKASIQSDAATLLSFPITTSSGLSCNSSQNINICMTGKEAYFQPVSNGVLFMGGLASFLIVTNRKKKK